MATTPSASAAMACNKWDKTVAACHFFDDANVNWCAALESHWEQATERMAAQWRCCACRAYPSWTLIDSRRRKACGRVIKKRSGASNVHPMCAATTECEAFSIIEALDVGARLACLDWRFHQSRRHFRSVMQCNFRITLNSNSLRAERPKILKKRKLSTHPDCRDRLWPSHGKRSRSRNTHQPMADTWLGLRCSLAFTSPTGEGGVG